GGRVGAAIEALSESTPNPVTAVIGACGGVPCSIGHSVMKATMAFYAAYLLCLVLSVVCVVLVVDWNARYRGGFAWDQGPKQFNWHPVLMVLGLVVFYGNAAVVYRIPLTWGQNKLPWKLLHAGLLLLSLLCAVVGLCAVFGFHNSNNTPNLYSLHSWVGIVTTFLFATQWAAGFGTFLLPFSPVALRVLMKPVHVWMGAIIFVLSIVSCISGINEKLFFALKKNTNGTLPYDELPPEAVLANTLGVIIVAFGLVVLKILAYQKWRRPEPRSEAGEYRFGMTRLCSSIRLKPVWRKEKKKLQSFSEAASCMGGGRRRLTSPASQ
ncbi:hypothetical protein NFI96_026598, partial [Prochilodus magdalenae]